MRIMSMYFNYVMDIFETWIVKGVDLIFKSFKITRLYIIRKCFNQICPKIISHLGFSSLYLIASLFMLSLASSKIFPWKIFVSTYMIYVGRSSVRGSTKICFQIISKLHVWIIGFKSKYGYIWRSKNLQHSMLLMLHYNKNMWTK